MRGATSTASLSQFWFCISIHAPHAGCDIEAIGIVQDRLDFNPRTPCGVRPHGDLRKPQRYIFQSTHPMRGATILFLRRLGAMNISIHAPHAGCDIVDSSKRCKSRYFNPRTPCGVRHFLLWVARERIFISIHAPHAGCDLQQWLRPVIIGISIHAPHAGCDRSRASTNNSRREFQSTHPMRGATLVTPAASRLRK